jgi:3-oxoacyl-[acyl-carrier protein] reductase
MLQFDDQLVIVTGGTRGIGKAISHAFLDRGASVVATYVSGSEAAETFKAEHPHGERLGLAQFDVSDPQAVEAFFGELESPPQVIINNAGIRRDQIVGMLSFEDWNRVLEINLGGSFLMSKFGVRAMSSERYGRIINISSPSGRLGIKGQANYAASKAGQVALAKTLATEVAKRKITVNCVEPGFIETELIEDLPQELRAEYKSMVPLKRFGTPQEVAYAVLFLASREASYITGTTLAVAGGLG